MNYQLPGMTLSVRADHLRVEQALNNIFDQCPRSQQNTDVNIRGYATNRDNFEKQLPQWIVAQLPKVKLGLQPTMLYNINNQAAAVGVCEKLHFCAWNSSDNTQIHFVCTLGEREFQYGLFHPVLVPVLREIYVSKGLYLLHSAGVRCPKGVGMLFIAVSGGGKTTTALSMVRRKAKLIADDLIVLNPSRDVTRAGGIPKVLNLRAKTISLFEELACLPESSFLYRHKEKKSVPVTQLYGTDCLTAQADIQVVYFVRVAGQRPAVRRLPVAESVKRLALAHGFSANQTLGSHSIEGITSALSNMAAYELLTGTDPNYLGDWLLRHSSEHSLH